MADSWRIHEQDPDKILELTNSKCLDPLLIRCLLNREVQQAEIESFLNPTAYQSPDPFLLPDMKLAVERIQRALAQEELICIYGDSDADGVTAISILLRAFRELAGNVFHHIPDRHQEGVGLNSERLRLFKEELDVGLVITVDTGIRSFDELRFALDIGLDLIVTDHHEPDGERPEGFAIINPKLQESDYPFNDLCAAGLAFKLVQALNLSMPGRLNLSQYYKIAAIGTIADMVPLREENRWLVAMGLREINTEHKGSMRTLLDRLGLRGMVGSLDISFKVAPRINAPGRLGKPDTAIQFFVEESPNQWEHLVDTMDSMNLMRRAIERDLEEKLEIQLHFRQIPSFILIAGSQWHRGILGILACKLTRRFNRPACVLSLGPESAHGSLRSIPGVNLLEPLHQLSSLFINYGGHPEAAGVSMHISNVALFKARMIELLTPQVKQAVENSPPIIDAELRWNQLNRRLYESIYKLAPFGIGNAAPTFLTRGLILESELQRKGLWLYFEASDGYVTHRCTYYHPRAEKLSFERFDSVDLIYSLSTFRDEYQIQVADMRHSNL